MRLVDKLDKLPVDQVRDLLVDEAGATDAAGRAGAGPGDHPQHRRLVRRPRCVALGVEHPLLEEGLAELAALVARLRGPCRRPGPHRGRPVDRPRAGLLHRHRLRDPPGRLRVAGLDLLAAGATTPWPATAAPPTPASASRSALSRARGAPAGPHRHDGRPCGAQRRAGGRSPTRRAGRVRRHRHRAAHPRRALRGGGQRREVRQADPLRRATRHPLRLVHPARPATRSRTSARGSRWTPTRPPGPRPPTTSDRRSSPAQIRSRSSDPHP